MKKYLKTIEDIEALKDTDTVIHYGGDEKYLLRFVNGVLCSFYKENTDHLKQYHFNLDIDLHQPYIEVEDELACEDDIGKLGWFWDNDADIKDIDFLKEVSRIHDIPYRTYSLKYYRHFRPLTPEEVEKYTGYKVVNNEIQASGLDDNKIQAKVI